MSKIWYTYHIIDPETNKVFYIGKGFGPRMRIHMTRALKWRKTNYANQKCNKHLYSKLLQIKDKGLDPIYIKIFESEIEKEALDREKLEIAKFGLENLCNITYGGEGETKTPETLKKISESLNKFWNSEDGNKLRREFSEARMGENNPRWGVKEEEDHKKLRMAPALAAPRWNKGLKGDPRSKGLPKGNIPHNALPCRLINEDGRIFEAKSIRELSKISGVPLISINRLHLGIYKKNKKGWRFELINKSIDKMDNEHNANTP
jgi:hypothetical protein